MNESGLILVADDNESVRYARIRILRRAGYDVLEAATGNEVLQIVSEHKPRLVLLDVQMPDINGWEVCRQLKTNPATANIIVLQISATYVHGSDTVRALEGGADACLTEPLEPTVLLATVKALLRARQAEDQLRVALEREQAARAAAEAVNKTKDEFLATLSHELRSPLGAILTWVTLLRTGAVDPERTNRALEAIERNTRLQVKLIDDLLDVSRIITGKLNLEIEDVDLGAVVAAALDSVRGGAADKNIALDVEAATAVPPVAGDPMRLQQIVTNLLSNAVKFTGPNGTVAVRLAAEDTHAMLTVRDTGRGIDAAFLPHLFERFRQADSSSTRAEGGLGIGLAIVWQLAELHHGSVEAESPGLGHGSTFTLRIPLQLDGAAATPAPRVRVPAAPAALEHGDLQGLRILLVDDERDARDAIGAVLRLSGATVTAVENVRGALDELSRGDTDVLVSDIAMPGEDGYALIQQVRSAAKKPPAPLAALALTAYAGADERRRVLAAGFDAYLSKPVEAVDLVDAVRRLGRQRAV